MTGPAGEVPEDDAKVRLGLMDVPAHRPTAEAAVLLLPGVLTWYFHAISGTADLLPWALGMALIAPLLHLSRRRYRAERQRLSAQEMLRRWELRLVVAGGLYGLAWSLPPLLILHPGPVAFTLIFYMVLQGVCIGATAHLSALFPAFVAMMLGVWTPALLAVPAFYPVQWMYLLPMFLLFTLVITRHGWGMYRFMRRQLLAERQERELAERYRLARDEAQAALHDRSLFLATASHDLRQPVHAMGLLVEAVARRNADPAIEPMLDDLRLSMHSVNLMFGSLLDLSRLESGRATPQPAGLRLADLLEEVETLFREQAARRGLQLRVHPPPPDARVWADHTLMRQSLVNLVNNALRYTERGGLLLGVRRRGDHWQTEVWDTGIGIASKDDERIFSPFYREEHAWRIDSAGHGLGLAVVARCARLMGADLGFQSRLGKGSRFWLRLPIWREPLPIPAAEGSSPSHASPPQDVLLAGTCLVVDDDPAVQTAWAALLESWGVRTCCVASGEQALAALDQGLAPHAILCDQRLRSGESGFEVLRTLLDRCPGASGAMVSGEHDSPELQEADAEGYLVLRKPVDAPTLLAVLSAWLPVPAPQSPSGVEQPPSGGQT